MSKRVPRIVGAGWKNKTRTGNIDRIQMAFTKENIAEIVRIARMQFASAGVKYAYFDIYPNTRRLNDRAPELHMTAYVEGQPGEDDILAQAEEILNMPDPIADQN